MITVGIDMGSKNVKVLVLKDGDVVAKVTEAAGFEPLEAAKKAFQRALSESKIAEKDVNRIFATGAGRKTAPHAQDSVTESTAVAKGAVHLVPSARTVIDVGAEEGRAVQCDETGKVIDFAINEKCAAGAGAFTESMARALEVKLEEFGQLSLKSTKSIPMNAQCAVFAESEVVSLTHAKTSKEDIARAVHDAISSRIVSMVRRVGINEDVVVSGGLSYNPGFVEALGRGLETKLTVLENPEYVCALGAAIVASERK